MPVRLRELFFLGTAMVLKPFLITGVEQANSTKNGELSRKSLTVVIDLGKQLDGHEKK